MLKLLIRGSLFLLLACDKNYLPKPKAKLRLEYPASLYEDYSNPCGYTFLKNKITFSEQEGCEVKIVYPRMKAKIHLNYRKIKGNLSKLLEDAQRFTYKHVVKADQIEEALYENPNSRVYGMKYDVQGDAASQTQFYLTDSLHHFLRGAIYFYAKPNYDSILPAVHYINRDINILIETLEWKN